ncbi:MAG: CPBP family intramembrane metalloprotease [Clostridiales bacterium]|nr:CPBP family intramembrane metalloprotease [Clostridiales bacterium]
MVSFEDNLMFKEASSAKHKFKPIIVLLIFALVFEVSSIITNIICFPSMLVWGANELQEQMKSFDTDPNDFFGLYSQIMSSMPYYVTLFMLLGTIGQIIAPIIYVTKIEKRSLGSMGFFKKNFFGRYGFGYAFGALVILAIGLISFAIGITDISVSDTINPVIFLFFLGYLIQGTAEEVMCRGFLMISLRNSMKNKHRTLWSLIISALVFALLHSLNPGITVTAMLNLFVSGLFLGLLVLRYDNIWTACAAHSAWNFFQGHVLGSQVSGLGQTFSFFTSEPKGAELLTGGSFGFEGGLILTGVVLLACILLVFIPRRRKA